MGVCGAILPKIEVRASTVNNMCETFRPPMREVLSLYCCIIPECHATSHSLVNMFITIHSVRSVCFTVDIINVLLRSQFSNKFKLPNISCFKFLNWRALYIVTGIPSLYLGVMCSDKWATHALWLKFQSLAFKWLGMRHWILEPSQKWILN